MKQARKGKEPVAFAVVAYVLAYCLSNLILGLFITSLFTRKVSHRTSALLTCGIYTFVLLQRTHFSSR